MGERMTWRKAWRRIASTAAQAAAATGLVWIGLWVGDEFTTQAAGLAFASAFAVPVMTAAQRLAEAWRQQEYAEDPVPPAVP